MLWRGETHPCIRFADSLRLGDTHLLGGHSAGGDFGKILGPERKEVF